MDRLIDYVKVPCVDHERLAQMLIYFCSASPRTAESKVECALKGLRYHNALCKLADDNIISQIKSIHDTHSKDYVEICKDIYEKRFDLFRKFLSSVSKILKNTPEVVEFSQQYQMSDFSLSGEYIGPLYDRATFIKKLDRLVWAWDSNSQSSDDYYGGDILNGHQHEPINKITVKIDDDYNIEVYTTEDDEPIHTIPFVNASSAEMKVLCSNLQTMNVDLDQTPVIEGEVSDHIRNIIRSLSGGGL